MSNKITVNLPKLHPAQQGCLDRAKRFNMVVAGEHAGKTTLAIEVLLAGPRGALHSKKPVAYIHANDEGASAARRMAVKALGPLVRRRANSKRLELATGGAIDFISLGQKFTGVLDSYALVVIDDARHVSKLLDFWEDSVLPSLNMFTGQAWLISGAFGKRSDFYKLWAAHQGDADWAFSRIQSFDNPDLPTETAEAAMAATDVEFEQRFGAEFLDVAFELSSGQRVIKPNETFRQWCERLAEEGLKVDGKPFTLDDRPAMAWIYEQIPSTVDEAFRLVLVLMKCAQVGFTVMEMLATIYLGLKFGPATVGMFLPDQSLADIKSSKRFMPVVRTVPAVHALMTMEAADGSGRKAGEGNVRVRQIGEAMFVFSWTTGRATTESIPMDILSYDEVQEMTLEQMEKTQERLSASPVRFTLMGSTANWPDSDIHHWYKRGSQHRFHTTCKTCGTSKPLDDYFPECIRIDPSTDIYRYVCPNGHVIDDTQHGEWIADNPEADKPVDLSVPKKDRPLRIRSIHFPQFLSPTISAEEILFAYRSATDMKNFFNRKLGKPYLDPSQVPVNMEHLHRCVEAGKLAGVVWKSRGNGCFMGIDQMGNFNVHIIKERLPDGRQAVVHVEMTYSEDPFERSSELMEQYGVAVCVVEINPNYNDAKKFAARHPGRVFICDSFGSLKEDMIIWGDAPALNVSDRRTSEEARDRWTLRMDQYKCMQVSMARFTAAEPLCLFPDPQGLVQEIVEKGQRQAKAVLPVAFHHFTKTALVAEKDDETNQYKRSVKKVGIDPHFSYANMLCDVAWARSHGTSTFILPQEKAPITDVVGDRLAKIPVIAKAVAQAQPLMGDVCGRCANRDKATGMCSEYEAITLERDPGCMMFIGT